MDEQVNCVSELTAREYNIIRSPKRNGTARADSVPYLNALGIEIIDNPQPIRFLPNSTEIVHRWSPYVQGFSAQFVQKTLDDYQVDYTAPTILDPFAGSGTVIVQAQLNDMEAYGIELNPLLQFIAETKIGTWHTNPEKLARIASNLARERTFEAPKFLKSRKHFNAGVLHNLETLKSGIDNFVPATAQDKCIKDLLLLAFAAILIDCSNLKRTPCLGYSRRKVVATDAPFKLFAQKVAEIGEDLQVLQFGQQKFRDGNRVFLANSMSYEHATMYDLAITSPPYMNGLDYVMNYKIEMGWLGFAQNQRQLRRVKNEMVVCDNVSKGLIRTFAARNQRYTNDWLEKIKQNIARGIARRGSYRREDMPEIVHKYFDDMYKVMRRVVNVLRPGGRCILVVGDSLIADAYVPTDLILARMGKEMGLTIEKIEKARSRRSGQIRSYKLRETIVTLKKE